MHDPSLPAGQLLYAVGDIHGRADLLATLLSLIEADAAKSKHAERRTLVFVGDYVDRGPDSRDVVDRLISGLPEGFDAHFLKGNHEAILLDFLDDAGRLDHWLMNGGDATLSSYGVDCQPSLRGWADQEQCRKAFVAALPDAHRRFFESLKLSQSFGDYLFVHAGVRPGVALDAQDPDDLVWIRGEFLDSEMPFGQIVVHGHTPAKEPVLRVNRIGIDTGAYFSNRLTALRLEGSSRSFLQT